MNGSNRNKQGKKVVFENDPFYLYPLKDDLMFVDREEEVQIARGLLMTGYKGTVEICAVIGGIGIGKSSMLNFIGSLAAGMGHQVTYLNANDRLAGTDTVKPGEKTRAVLIVDDVDKADDERARLFYTELGKVQPTGSVIFFADTYDRSAGTSALRNHTVSHNISLPQRLQKERLTYFLEERMRKCLAPGKGTADFAVPFDDNAIEMAATRSKGNLRNFLNYTKHAWMAATGQSRDRVGRAELKTGMLSIDRALLGGCDIIDMKILWFSTAGDMNKALLAHRCGVDARTVDARMAGRLSEFLEEGRTGKETFITSVYRRFAEGEDLMRNIIMGLGYHLSDVTGLKD
jgi:hypothetical protein